MNVPHLRSPYDLVGGLCHFGRMLDKIRLNLSGELPADYAGNLGAGFDGVVCKFLGVNYADLVARAKGGGDDAELLRWCQQNGRAPGADEIEMFNDYLRKRGWNDAASERLAGRVREMGAQWAGRIHTFFDLIEADEGRQPRSK